MRYIADLHIHSPYSRATSSQSTLAGLFTWARIKGINLIGSGDFTHPTWFKALGEQLIPSDTGFHRLREEKSFTDPVCAPAEIPVRFALTAEISSIYKRHGQVRKVHNLIVVPDFDSASRLNARLAAIGNIESDGRPILGLDSRDLLEIVLENAPGGFLVPAHVWTPWFSLFGSKSGFDSVEECFGDLSRHVFALETGLSSDPAMNRLISALDRFSLISNSDCHSPSKLGREANLFDCDFTFAAMRQALEDPYAGGFCGTIEFFPEEGKYHWDGHRKCGVCLDPAETMRKGAACPVCGRELTIGVGHRVMELADRDAPFYPNGRPNFTSLIPLPEILGEILDKGPATKGVMEIYGRLISRFGSEFNLLLDADVDELNEVSPLLSLAIARMRSGQVIRDPGYDGEFGRISVFEQTEIASLRGQASLFADAGKTVRKVKKPDAKKIAPAAGPSSSKPTPAPDTAANPEQEEAITSQSRHILVAAGPGSGKTHTLTERLRRLVEGNAVDPARAVVITFTNRAADELSGRLRAKLSEGVEKKMSIGTFHAFCLSWLRERDPALAVAGDEEQDLVLRRLFPDLSRQEQTAIRQRASAYFTSRATGETPLPADQRLDLFRAELDRLRLIALDEMVPAMVAACRADEAFAARVGNRIGHLFVDEFQDLNQSQYELVVLLARSATTFAIGDPDQAIYGFRGSDPIFFHDFSKQSFGGEPVKNIRLRLNYRSATKIIAAAASVIRHNQRRDKDEGMAPLSTESGAIERHAAPTVEAEAEYIVRRIEESMGGISSFSLNSGRGGEHGDTMSFADFAILCRTRSQFPAIRDALHRRGIPCQIVGDTPFFMETAIRPACYLALAAAGLATPAEQIALALHLPGVGLRSQAILENLSLSEHDILGQALAADLPSTAREKIDALRAHLEALRQNAGANSVASGLAGILPFLEIDPASVSAPRLLELAGLFGRDLAGFAAHLRKNSETTIYDERAEAVSLMTIHASKGLEFAAVFLPGLEEGLLPLRPDAQDNDIEEERRLFYVAMTRAKRLLFLSSSGKRIMNGRAAERAPSRFLAEIPAGLVGEARTTPKKRAKNQGSQLSLF